MLAHTRILQDANLMKSMLEVANRQLISSSNQPELLKELGLILK